MGFRGKNANILVLDSFYNCGIEGASNRFDNDIGSTPSTGREHPPNLTPARHHLRHTFQ